MVDDDKSNTRHHIAVRHRAHSEDEKESWQSRVSGQVAWIPGKVQLVGRSLDGTMNSRRFHLTLPSNASMDCYPNNTAAQYSTKLPRNINLEGTGKLH